MSLDFPNRQEWLRVRATPVKRPAKFIHISTKPAFVTKLADGTPFKVQPKGVTFAAGRNAEKRATRGNPIGEEIALMRRRMRQRQGAM